MSKITVDNMILTQAAPTTAGSKMLDGFMSLLDAECLVRLTDAGYTMVEKTAVGEYAIDLLGETAFSGEKNLRNLKDAVEDNFAGVCLDVNGYPRRVAAQNGLVSIKPTYGTVFVDTLIKTAQAFRMQNAQAGRTTLHHLKRLLF